MENLFRKKSLDRISSPEELHDYLRVTSPSLWMVLAAIMVLLQEMRGFAEYRMLIFGLMMIVMMIWRPNGLLPMHRPHMELHA